ncbi:MAG: hypothetical protein KF886_14100 [Candidatus Hydrogenedentes bacterium]|nr:hypothetical protein [Candidatus Hydrogenedentota bacterium]
MKAIVIGALALVLGVIAGAGGMHQWLMPQWMETSAALAQTERELAALKTANSESQDKLARLERERDQFNDRLDAAYAMLESTQRPAAPDFAAESAPIADAALELAPEPAVEGAPAREDGSRPEGGRRGPGEGRWGGTPEEREARRQEFTARLQENMSNFFTGELEHSSTPEMQQRLIALEQKSFEMFDLRSQMRLAETDEEREALGRAFGQVMDDARQLMIEQQQDMLGAIATQFGISRPGDQAAFEQAVRSAISSPLFSTNPGALLWNSGGGGFGEGRGGFGGGFGGGPGGGRGR